MDILSYILGKKYTQENAVYPADLTGQADGDYVSNDSGVWKPKTKIDLTRDVLFTDQWYEINTVSDFTYATTSGNGNILKRQRHIEMSAGPTVNSMSRLETYYRPGYSMGHQHNMVDYNKLIVIKCRLSHYQASSNCKSWLFLGSFYLDDFGDPTRKSIGVRLEGTALKGITHDGATLYSVDLSHTVGTTAITDVTIVSKAGQVAWYVNDVLKSTSSNGPTGDDVPAIRLQFSNYTDEVAAKTYFYIIKIFVEQ